MAHDVFVCHSAEDRTIAQGACARLEGSGIGCWIAPRNALAGVPYGRQLIDAIASTSIVLLILSSQTNESEHVLSELELAYNRNKIILPFRIEDVQPSGDLEYYIKRVHWLDAVEPPFEMRLDELVDRVEGLLATLNQAVKPGEQEVSSTQQAASIAAPATAAKPHLSVTTSASGKSLTPGAPIEFSYVPLAEQIDDEEVRFIDGEGSGKIATVSGRARDASSIRGTCTLPGDIPPGSKVRVKVTTWDSEGTPISGIAVTPFTVGAPGNAAASATLLGALSQRSPLYIAGGIAAAIVLAIIAFAAMRGGNQVVPAGAPPTTQTVQHMTLPARSHETPPSDSKWSTFGVLPGLFKTVMGCKQISDDARTLTYRVYNTYETHVFAYLGTGSTPDNTDAWVGRKEFAEGLSHVFYSTIPGRCGDPVYYWLRTIRFNKDLGPALAGTAATQGTT